MDNSNLQMTGGNSKLDMLMKEMVIPKEPVHTLSECLGCYSEEFLMQMAERLEVEASGVEKDGLVALIKEKILERMPADILFDDIEDLKKYYAICESGKDANLELFSGIFRYLIRGWMFFFVGKDMNSVKLTMPDEILKFVYNELNNDGSMEKAALFREMRTYLWGLDHLYGAYEKSQFVAVWNEHHEKKITDEDFQEFVTDVMSRYSVCHEEGTYIVTNSVEDYHIMTMLLRNTQGMEYYMPTPEDIKTYQDGKVDMTSSEYTELKNYLHKKIRDARDLDNVIYMLETLVVLEASASDVQYSLNFDKVAFDDPADADIFWGLYTALANSVRLWSRRGFTASEKGEVLSYRREDLLPEVKITYKKVGRNDPCPCGSGKKYKNCCGKAVDKTEEEPDNEPEVIIN